MNPHPSSTPELQGDLFKVELETIINPDHPLIRLGSQIDWVFFEREIGARFCGLLSAGVRKYRINAWCGGPMGVGLCG